MIIEILVTIWVLCFLVNNAYLGWSIWKEYNPKDLGDWGALLFFFIASPYFTYLIATDKR